MPEQPSAASSTVPELPSEQCHEEAAGEEGGTSTPGAPELESAVGGDQHEGDGQGGQSESGWTSHQGEQFVRTQESCQQRTCTLPHPRQSSRQHMTAAPPARAGADLSELFAWLSMGDEEDDEGGEEHSRAVPEERRIARPQGDGVSTPRRHMPPKRDEHAVRAGGAALLQPHQRSAEKGLASGSKAEVAGSIGQDVRESYEDVCGCMPWISQAARRAVAAAVRAPIKWASARLRTPMRQEQMAKEQYQHPPDTMPYPPYVGTTETSPTMPAGAPKGPICIEQLYSGDAYSRLVVPWLLKAEEAMTALEKGLSPPSVPTVTLTQEDMPEWARGVVWDTANPRDCHPVRRSNSHSWDSDFPGDRLNPDALRREAERLGWRDRDIVEQIAGGGLEGRFDCTLSTVLAFHHRGVVKPPAGLEHCEAKSAGAGFAQVDKVVQHDVQRGWTSAATPHLQYVPTRCVPRNVVMNLKYKTMPDGSIERYWKPRVTTDDSFPHDGTSMNDATDPKGTGTSLPTPQHLAWALAIIQTATDRAGLEAVLWGLDFSDAYRYCPVQKSEHWAQCFVWRGGVHVERRGVFGAAWMPNRFQRLANLARAAALRDVAAFEADVPPPPQVQAWSEARRRSGLDGEHLMAWFCQIYIDDSLGCGTSDIVELPERWEHLRSEQEHEVAARGATQAVGGSPAHPYSRGAVHARIAAKAYARLGFHISMAKSQVGSKVGSLGLRTNADERCLDCIPHRAAALRAEAMELLSSIQPGGEVDGRRLERFVGRVNYIAQVAPEFKQYLRYGYAALNGVGASSGRRRPMSGVKKNRTRWLDKSRLKVARFDAIHAKLSCWRGVRQLLQLVASTVRELKVPLAPSPRFMTPEEGAALVHLDASRGDGFGGWMWQRDSEARRGWRLLTFDAPWPAEVRQQLMVGDDRLSMPAGELAASLVAKTMAEDVLKPAAVIVVTDCAPVAGAVNAMVSPSPQLHELLRATYATSHMTQLLAVHVKREHNQEADDLSKGQGAVVRARATSEGYDCRRWPVWPNHPVWEALRRAARLPQQP